MSENDMQAVVEFDHGTWGYGFYRAMTKSTIARKHHRGERPIRMSQIGTGNS